MVRSSVEKAAWQTLAESATPRSGGAAPDGHACSSCGTKCPRCRDGKPCAQGPWCTWCAEIYRENAPDPADGRVYCGGPDPDTADGCNYVFPDFKAFVKRYHDPDPARRLRRYPRYCSECREEREAASAAKQREQEAAERRAERAAERELDRTIGADAVVNNGKPKPTAKGRTPKLPAGPPPAYREEHASRAEHGEQASNGVTAGGGGSRYRSRGEEVYARELEAIRRDPNGPVARGGFVPRIGHDTGDPYPNHSEMSEGATAPTGMRPFARPLEPWEV